MDSPDPHELLRQAEEEEDRLPLHDYGRVIRLLRDQKHFSFRAISDWLIENGVETNQSAVYRAYQRLNSRAAGPAANDEDEYEERD